MKPSVARGHTDAVGRLLAILVLVLAPWTVLVGEGVHLVFPWGLASVDPIAVVTITEYLFRFTAGLPDHLLAWPSSSLLLGGALVGAAAEAVDRGDRRVTVGLLALAGLSHLAFAVGVATRGTQLVFPVGPALVVLVLWRGYPGEIGRFLGDG